MNNEKIMAKIRNLFDLANNNPNEHEALAAALKAQELMAKYGIDSQMMSEETPEAKELAEAVYHDNGKHEMKKWKTLLARTISKNFRCKFYFAGKSIVFYGYKADTMAALETFSFLYKIGNKLAFRCYNEYRKQGKNTKGLMNTYLSGFVAGIDEALNKQSTALMVVTPKEVTESFEQMTAGWKTKSLKLKESYDAGAYMQGKADGKDAIGSKSLEDKKGA